MADEKKYQVQIKDGLTYGKNKQHKGGQTIVVTAQEVRDFGDKFTNVKALVVEDVAPKFDLATATTKEVLAAIESGLVTAEEALAAEEKRPSPRKSVLEALAPQE